MFGMGAFEMVAGLFMLVLWFALIVFLIRFALRPVNDRLDRIIDLMKERNRQSGT
jgi:4-hydroxybenzoate polyprenyltransferase